MSSIKVSIIYVNYNTQALLENSLQSLLDSKLEFSYEVIVVENGSREFDPKGIQQIMPSAKIVPSKVNLGFGAGNNLGAVRAKAEYLWLLNTDTLVPYDNDIDNVINWLNEHPEYAAATPLLVNKMGEKQFGQVGHFPSLWRMILEKPVSLITRISLPLAAVFGGLNPQYVPSMSTDVEQAVAASLLVRKKAFEKVGGFSKEYFFFYEDTDLCRKFAEAKLKVRFVAEAKIVHLLGGSIASQYERKQKYYTAQDTYFHIWKSWPSGMIVKALRVPLQLIYKLRG